MKSYPDRKIGEEVMIHTEGVEGMWKIRRNKTDQIIFTSPLGREETAEMKKKNQE